MVQPDSLNVDSSTKGKQKYHHPKARLLPILGGNIESCTKLGGGIATLLLALLCETGLKGGEEMKVLFLTCCYFIPLYCDVRVGDARESSDIMSGPRDS
jgi:hypothetical protein